MMKYIGHMVEMKDNGLFHAYVYTSDRVITSPEFHTERDAVQWAVNYRMIIEQGAAIETI